MRAHPGYAAFVRCYFRYKLWQDNQNTVRVIGPGECRLKGEPDGTSSGKGWTKLRDKFTVTVAPTIVNRRPTMKNQATNPKDAEGQKKPQLHLIPPVANVYEAMVMKTGADKYGPFNWRKDKIALSTYISAMYRHLAAFQDGQTIDMDSGQPHIAHLRANTGIVLDAMEEGMTIDDRFDGHAGDVMKGVTRSEVDLVTSGTKMTSSEATYYIAGPMRGYFENNFLAFDIARDKGTSLGYDMISPADMDRDYGFDPTDYITEDKLQSCIDRDVAVIMNLDPKTDGIAALKNWHESEGAFTEVTLAKWRGLEVISGVDFKTVIHQRRS